MAIEDEIINIADLDVGTELLKTDKLLIETNNGTKLLDFKDFVIGPDNISSVRDDQIEYEMTGEAATRAGNTSFSVVSGFNILNSDTTPGLKTSYKDLSGSIELGKFNYDAIKNLATLSGGWEAARTKIDSLDLWAAQLDDTFKDPKFKDAGLPTFSISAVNFLYKGGKVVQTGAFPAGVYFESGPDVDPRVTNEDVILENGSADTPFSITYPTETDGSFRASYIFFKLQYKYKSSRVVTVRVLKNGVPLPASTSDMPSGNTSVRVNGNLHFIEYIIPGDKITLSSPGSIVQGTLQFEGFKLAT